ncbi:hypothetical protein CEXT_413441 [Caerostris extrusa]|uniref:Uncharacterized protein n=1 Tax=Caerostris extrusa TaxID=172846 RepID=A0AAV4N286_CAEEX|nr:hypothetical protein CEXT_413441 [Caerostris extrusa]
MKEIVFKTPVDSEMDLIERIAAAAAIRETFDIFENFLQIHAGIPRSGISNILCDLLEQLYLFCVMKHLLLISALCACFVLKSLYYLREVFGTFTYIWDPA